MHYVLSCKGRLRFANHVNLNAGYKKITYTVNMMILFEEKAPAIYCKNIVLSV